MWSRLEFSALLQDLNDLVPLLRNYMNFLFRQIFQFLYVYSCLVIKGKCLFSKLHILKCPLGFGYRKKNRKGRNYKTRSMEGTRGEGREVYMQLIVLVTIGYYKFVWQEHFLLYIEKSGIPFRCESERSSFVQCSGVCNDRFSPIT